MAALKRFEKVKPASLAVGGKAGIPRQRPVFANHVWDEDDRHVQRQYKERHPVLCKQRKRSINQCFTQVIGVSDAREIAFCNQAWPVFQGKVLLGIAAKMQHYSHDVQRHGAANQSGRGLNTATNQQVGGDPIQQQSCEGEDRVADGDGALKLPIGEKLVFQQPQKTVRAVQRQVHKRTCAKVLIIAHQRKHHEKRGTFMQVNWDFEFHTNQQTYLLS